MKLPFRILAFAALLGFAGCTEEKSSVAPEKATGEVALRVSATSSVFTKLASTAVLTVSASDMETLTRNLSVTSTTLSGSIQGIPVGKNRLFEIKVYDSTGTLQYQGSGSANINAGINAELNLSVIRVVGSATINGEVIESPGAGWSVFDGFEGTAIGSNWTPRGTTAGTALTTSQKKTGSKAFQVNYDYRYLFPKSLTNGQISWWSYDQTDSYFFVLTDTSKADMTVDNLHMTTVQPLGLLANRYSFYYKVGGYQQVARTPGWRQFTVTVANGQITWSVDGVTTRTISQTLPVLGVVVSTSIIDDFYVVSNTN